MRHTSFVRLIPILAVVVTLLGVVAYAEPRTSGSTANAPATSIGFTPAEQEVIDTASKFLRSRAAQYSLRADLADLEVVRVVLSLGADDVRFQQLYQGVQVEGAAILVSVPHDRTKSFYIGSSYNPHLVVTPLSSPYPGASPSGLTPPISSPVAITRASNALAVKGELLKQATAELTIFPRDTSGKNTLYVFAWKVSFIAREPYGDWIVFVDANAGQILSKENHIIGDPNSHVPATVPVSSSKPSTPTSTTIPQSKSVPVKAPAPGFKASTVHVSPSTPPRTTPVKQQGTPDHKVAPSKPDQRKLSAGRSSPLAPDFGWTQIMTETFEGVWNPPQGLWYTYGDPTWNDDNFLPHTDGWSAWCAGGTLDPQYNNYPNNLDSWMVYGPFNLSDANLADLQFYYWNQSEPNYDYFGWYASIDGSNFYGYRVSGDSLGWQPVEFDLTSVPTIGNTTGQSAVWIAFIFTSDGSITDTGAFVDDILLRKYVPAPPPNLAAYTPSGWASSVVPSTFQGTHSVSTLYANQPTYIDWAIINNGGSTAYNFDIKLYRDGAEISSWHIDSLEAGYYLYVDDWYMPVVPLFDNHTLRIVADTGNTVSESNESDNAWQGTFNWLWRLGRVFNPNPVQSSGDTSPRDNNNQDSPLLTSQLLTVTLQGLDGSGYLRGQYADVTAPGMVGGYKPAGQAYDIGLIYSFTRSDDRFEEAMAYYHIDAIQRYIQSIGFGNVNNRAIPIHVHYLPCQNAFYVPGWAALEFGDGRHYTTPDDCVGGAEDVDLAEDADVIAHEYGHSIQDNQVPGWGALDEGRAMGEGFGDYWAASYYSGVNGGWRRDVIADWAWVPNGLRNVSSTKHYPQDITGETHSDGEIWSALLWQIWNALGRNSTDRLLIRSHFLIVGDQRNARFGEGADALVAADQALNAGVNIPTISNLIRQRGIFDAYELDNASSNSTMIVPNGASQTHNFHSYTDEDWARFNAVAWNQYLIQTSNLGPNADTFLDLFSSNGTTLLTSNDDCGAGTLRSCITWTAPLSGLYYVKVRPYSTARTGRDSNYDLSITIQGQIVPKRNYLPLILR